ncbi:MAG: hypothetical protein O6940_11925, partial [Ignavibacteria bacterium]|nr:hypothetical protein [Ignavibacteria bacterium]
SDSSDNNFTIIGNFINVSSPNGDESWQTETTQSITWIDNIHNDVRIDLYRDSLYHSTISDLTPSSGSYLWTIPLGTPNGSNYKIKIFDPAYPTEIFDFSNNQFTIFQSDITVTSPNGGDSWLVGTTQSITWMDNIAENVKIDLFKAGGFNSVIVGSTPSTGLYDWTIPVLTSGSDYTVMITSVSNSSVTDVSDSNFTIITPVITVTSPNGGENYETGTSQTITWTDNIAENVKIDLYMTGVFTTVIIASTPSTGSFNWTIPMIIDGSDYFVVITSVINPSVTDVSDSNFTIITPFISVTSPNGGETFETGSSQIITWDDNITENVKIDLYNAGVFNSNIISSTVSDGAYEWIIPAETSTDSGYIVLISSVSNTLIFDQSNGVFKVINMPNSFTLEQNFPNPFNSLTQISYSIPKQGYYNQPVYNELGELIRSSEDVTQENDNVELVIFNALGKKVRTLINDSHVEGFYVVEWDGMNDSGNKVSSGVYLYILKSRSFYHAKKMILLK